MTYFNNINNANFYSDSPGMFEAYPFWNQTLAIEEANAGVQRTFDSGWGGDVQPGLVAGSSTGLRAESSFGKYRCSFSWISILHVSLQSRCLQPPHTRPRRTVITTGRLPGSMSSPTTSTS